MTPRILVTLLVGVELMAFAAIFFLPTSRFLDSGIKPQECPQEEIPRFARHCTMAAPVGFDAMLLDAADEMDVDPRILATTVYRESGCNPHALGASGDIGLGQIVPSVWRRALIQAKVIHRTQDLWDPRTNLRATAWILNTLQESSKGSLYHMFRKYNGSGAKAHKYAHEQKALFVQLWGDSV